MISGKSPLLRPMAHGRRKPVIGLFQRLAASVICPESFDDCELRNEPMLEYKKCSKEREELEKELTEMMASTKDVPLVIGGKEMESYHVRHQVIPHRHSQKLCKYFMGDENCIKAAIKAAVKAQKKWDQTPFADRIAIWEKAADLMATKYRSKLVAATMLGQGKTVVQAEIDAAVELIDFTRMSAGFLKDLLKQQPLSPQPELTQNFMQLRSLEGFVAAISPFNFTAIGGNLAYTPALMGNSVVWKPSDAAIYSNWLIFQVMREAGVPDGVVNFCPADPMTFTNVCSRSEHLAGVGFTGSVPAFRNLWRNVTSNIDTFRTYPRLVGECGGKNFHFVHPSANKCAVVSTAIRAAFEYSGQKCSALSRMYVPASMWESRVRDRLVDKTKKLKVGDVTDFTAFTSSVIGETAFQRIVGYLEYAKSSSPTNEVLCGGTYQNLRGYFVDPTIVVSTDPNDRLFKEEIFGPLLVVYVYKDAALKKTMDLVADQGHYALTGSIFAEDEDFLRTAVQKFRRIAGNLYINDKCTGAVVGQQPFGGDRLSGTNDKAGSPNYLLRWTSPQAIKETYEPQMLINYKCQKEE